MKYLVRAVKYFFYFSIIIALVLTIFVYCGLVEGNIQTMFRNGYNSLWQIALMFAAVASIYPMFGFMRKDAVLPGETADIAKAVKEYMEDKGYRLESDENGEQMTFRYRSVMNKIFRMYEDRITFSRDVTGYSVEGLRKDVVRIIYGVEYKLRENQ